MAAISALRAGFGWPTDSSLAAANDKEQYLNKIKQTTMKDYR